MQIYTKYYIQGVLWELGQNSGYCSLSQNKTKKSIKVGPKIVCLGNTKTIWIFFEVVYSRWGLKFIDFCGGYPI